MIKEYCPYCKKQVTRDDGACHNTKNTLLSECRDEDGNVINDIYSAVENDHQFDIFDLCPYCKKEVEYNDYLFVCNPPHLRAMIFCDFCGKEAESWDRSSILGCDIDRCDKCNAHVELISKIDKDKVIAVLKNLIYHVKN